MQAAAAATLRLGVCLVDIKERASVRRDLMNAAAVVFVEEDA